MEFLGSLFHFSNFGNQFLFISSVTGPPGFGKSTTAQLLSREHGYVYYEGDCFSGLRNPYIPADVENPSMAQMRQRMLVGEGVEERREVCYKGIKQWEVRTLSTT